MNGVRCRTLLSGDGNEGLLLITIPSFVVEIQGHRLAHRHSLVHRVNHPICLLCLGTYQAWTRRRHQALSTVVDVVPVPPKTRSYQPRSSLRWAWCMGYGQVSIIRGTKKSSVWRLFYRKTFVIGYLKDTGRKFSRRWGWGGNKEKGLHIVHGYEGLGVRVLSLSTCLHQRQPLINEVI